VLTDFGIADHGKVVADFKDGGVKVVAELKGCTTLFSCKVVRENYKQAVREGKKLQCTHAADLWCFATTVLQMYHGGDAKQLSQLLALQQEEDTTSMSIFKYCKVQMPEGLQNIISQIFQLGVCLQAGSANLTKLTNVSAKGLVRKLTKLGGTPVPPLHQEGIAGPRLSCIHCNLGFALRFRSRILEANVHFERAVVVDPFCAYKIRICIQNAAKGDREADVVLDGIHRVTEAMIHRVIQSENRSNNLQVYFDLRPDLCEDSEDAILVSIFRAALWDQFTDLKLITDIGLLQVLRDELLLSKTFERELTQAVRADVLELELPLVEAARLSKISIIVDKTHFAKMFESSLLMLQSLTPHQVEKFKELMGLMNHVSDSSEAKHLQLAGPAGSGKTFIALHQILQTLHEDEAAFVVFVAQNSALAHFVAHWMYTRTKDGNTQICSRLHILCGPGLDSHCHFRVLGGKPMVQKFEQIGKDIEYSLLVVDEAHHLYSQESLVKRIAGFAKRFVKATTVWLLLSDVSQSTVFEEMYGHHVLTVQLSQVVRNSGRIVNAAMAFQTTGKGVEQTTCLHGATGPPLIPLLFDTPPDVTSRSCVYAAKVVGALRLLVYEYSGLELHNRVAIIVPDHAFIGTDSEFKQELVKGTRGISDQNISFCNAIEAIELGSKSPTDVDMTQTLVLDTVDNFDGLERLFVIAVGLDMPIGEQLQRAQQTRSRLYRAITRAHMMVIVVNEVIPGGWLEFLTRLRFGQKEKEDAMLQGGTARKVLNRTGRPLGGTEDCSPCSLGYELEIELLAKQPLLRSPSAPLAATGREKLLLTRSRTIDDEAQTQHHHVADASSDIRSRLAGRAGQGKASALDDKLISSVWNTSVLDSPWHSRTHAEISSDGFMPYFRESAEGAELTTPTPSTIDDQSNSLNLRVRSTSQFYDFGLVGTYRADIVTCHIDNLPEEHEQYWCLKSTSGNTYMFSRQRKYCFGISKCLGAAQHAFLLQETPAFGQYHYVPSERRMVIVTSLAAAASNVSYPVKDLKSGYLLQDRLSKGCEFICEVHECTFDNQNLYTFLPMYDFMLSDIIYGHVPDDGHVSFKYMDIKSCQTFFRQIMQGM
jgi:hypothetical protein